LCARARRRRVRQCRSELSGHPQFKHEQHERQTSQGAPVGAAAPPAASMPLLTRRPSATRHHKHQTPLPAPSGNTTDYCSHLLGGHFVPQHNGVVQLGARVILVDLPAWREKGRGERDTRRRRARQQQSASPGLPRTHTRLAYEHCWAPCAGEGKTRTARAIPGALVSTFPPPPRTDPPCTAPRLH
jgi:hypothetical protein